MIMSTLHVPDDLAARIEAEAARRGVSVDDLAVEALAARFPPPGADAGHDALEAFIASGRSGQTEPFEVHRARAALAERRHIEGV
jgi:hypothetical protein